MVLPREKQKIQQDLTHSNNDTPKRPASLNSIVNPQILDHEAAILSSVIVNTSKVKTVSKQPENQWQQTPSLDKSLWLNQYLMLSKIRLTSNVLYWM